MDRPNVSEPESPVPIHAILDGVQTVAFAVEIGVASSETLATNILRHHALFRSLVSTLRSEPASLPAALTRMEELAASTSDDNHENPWEIAIFTLLQAIATVKPELASYAAEIATRAPRTWWAATLAFKLLAASSKANIRQAQDLVAELKFGPELSKRRGPRVSQSGTSAPIRNAVAHVAGVALAASLLTPMVVSTKSGAVDSLDRVSLEPLIKIQVGRVTGSPTHGITIGGSGNDPSRLDDRL